MTTRAQVHPLRALARTRTPEPVLERVRLLLARRLEARARRSPAARGAAVVFHAVGPVEGELATQIDPPLSTARLDAATGYLMRRYTVVHASQLPSATRGRRAGERLPVALTFDDDLPSHLEHAAPVLGRHRAVATAFLCGAREPFWWQLLQAAVDARAIADHELPHVEPALVDAALARRPWAIGRLAKAVEELAPADRATVRTALWRATDQRPPVLDGAGAAALEAAGWEIGFHTRDHDLLTTLDDDALRAALEPAASTGARTLAYPHGKAGEREAVAARQAGYVAAYTGRSEAMTNRTDDHLIGRLQPDTGSLGRLALSLARALSAP